MPPKKKKKKTKAEKEAERLAKEEASRIQKKEEEKRIEEERLKKEEEARNALEERVRLRNIEIDRFEQNAEEIESFALQRNALLLRQKQVEIEEEEWEKIVGCNDAQWPESAINSLNTYISLEGDGHSFAKCAETIDRIMKDLEASRSSSNIAKTPIAQEDKATDCIRQRLLSMLMKKVDNATSRFLNEQCCRTLSGEDRQIVLEMGGKTGVGVAIWAAGGIKKRKSEALGMALEISACSKDVGIRACRFPFNAVVGFPFNADEDIPLLVFRFDVLKLPPVNKERKEWMICKTTDYNTADQDVETLGIAEVADPSDVMVEFNVAVPERIALSEHNHMVKRWDVRTAKWTADGILGYQYDTTSRTVTLQLRSLGVVGIIQQRQTDMPYKNWSLGPLLSDARHDGIVQYKLETPRFDLVINVMGSKCVLVGPDIPALKEILNLQLSPEHLLVELMRSGIHLIPANADAGKMDMILKMQEIEERAYFELGCLSVSYDSQASVFNSNLGRGRACYLIRESDAFTGGCDPSPMHVAHLEMERESLSCRNAPGAKPLPSHCGKVCCSIVNGRTKNDTAAAADTTICEAEDDNANLDLAVKDGTCSCLYISQCLKPLSSPEALERLKTASPILTETVKRLLQLTRPLSFC